MAKQRKRLSSTNSYDNVKNSYDAGLIKDKEIVDELRDDFDEIASDEAQDNSNIDDKELLAESLIYDDAPQPLIARITSRYGKKVLFTVLGGLLIFVSAKTFINALTVKEFRFFVNEQLVNQKNSVYSKSAEEVIDTDVLSKYKWFFNEELLREILTTVDVEIDIVSQNFSLFEDTYEIYLKESRPLIVYQQGDGQRYLINQLGRAYQSIDVGKTVENGAIVKDKSGVTIVEDDVALSPATVAFINDFNGFIQRNPKITLDSYLITNSQTLPVLILEEKNYFLKLNTERPAQSQYEAFTEVITTLNSSQLSNIEYIDLRIDGQAAYR